MPSFTAAAWCSRCFMYYNVCHSADYGLEGAFEPAIEGIKTKIGTLHAKFDDAQTAAVSALVGGDDKGKTVGLGLPSRRCTCTYTARSTACRMGGNHGLWTPQLILSGLCLPHLRWSPEAALEVRRVPRARRGEGQGQAGGAACSPW